MRKLLTLGLTLLPGGVLAIAPACGSSPVAAIPADAADDITTDTGLPDGFTLDVPVVVPDSGGDLCALGDGSDPVLLCSQQQALTYIVQYAYAKGTGVAPGFSSLPPGYARSPGHAWQDDLGLAAALGSYLCSADYYHNGYMQGAFDATLTDLGPILSAEVSQALSSYDGAAYFRMRNAALGFFLAQDAVDGAAMNAAAEAFARNLMTQFVHVVAAPPAAVDGGAPDAGKHPKDAGSPDTGPADAGPTTATVIGASAAGGAVAYAPGQVAMAAAALLDMAYRHAGDGDAGADVATWQATGLAALDYLWQRGRDPKTGLFFQSLVTSADPGHDALGPASPASDALLTDVQGAVVLALARAQSAALPLVQGDSGTAADGGLIAAPPFAAWAEALLVSLTGAGLFDGISVTPPSPPTYAAPAAFMEGLVPSLGITMTNKTTLGNALLLGGYSRAGSQGAASSVAYARAGMRWAISATNPAGAPWTRNLNMMSAVTDSLGDVTQLTYLRATSKAWGLATADGGTEPGATDYVTAATSAMVEGLSQYWYGRSGAPQCSF